MRNLFLFLARYHSFFIFILLEAFCFVLIVRYHRYHNAGFINSANVITGNTYSAYSGFTDYLHLKTINDSLQAENALLRNRLNEAFTDNFVKEQEICEPEQIYRYIPARVLNNSTNRANNFITLNRGYEHGIREEMGVIGANGAVGIVVSVSNNFSTVMSLLHKDCNISVLLSRTGYNGNLQWKSESPQIVHLNGIPKHVNIARGDTVVTSGFSSLFPSDIMVGTVEDFDVPSGSNFYDLSVRLSTDFMTLHYVFVVNYLLKDERKLLEGRSDE